jgi:hypothetical protein
VSEHLGLNVKVFSRDWELKLRMVDPTMRAKDEISQMFFVRQQSDFARKRGLQKVQKVREAKTLLEDTTGRITFVINSSQPPSGTIASARSAAIYSRALEREELAAGMMSLQNQELDSAN